MAGTYKIAIVGDAGVGKTNLVSALKLNHFEKRYFATIGTDVHPMAVRTNRGSMFVNVWDISGAETRWYGDNPISLADMHLVVVAYALDRRISYEHAMGYWTQRAGNVPTIMVGLKADIEPTVVAPPTDSQVSSKDLATVQAFWQRVVRRLTDDGGLQVLQ
jgi:small GTP-binding protein